MKTKKINKIIPRKDWVLVKPVGEMARENDFGILAPDSVEKEERALGEIVSMGPDVKGLKKGQTVLHGKYAGEQIKMSDSTLEQKYDYILLPDEEILAIIE